ncbi:hypothetical protein CkaCkLH20_09263 [Colletotrichum karsti]|uniref:Uncharacterized protein n=1 Tax=Colletotrichum karsti TaxID=1095194 RepID=A0A9P6I6X7_9PEZI|nr:uncharacterized protein CkaCkLH20_09263 [Colletotrichum karsti]KAF9873100.1 hypothetical protein CkaCkLH20_09263 [Colletotrichum karsti]
MSGYESDGYQVESVEPNQFSTGPVNIVAFKKEFKDWRDKQNKANTAENRLEFVTAVMVRLGELKVPVEYPSGQEYLHYRDPFFFLKSYELDYKTEFGKAMKKVLGK